MINSVHKVPYWFSLEHRLSPRQCEDVISAGKALNLESARVRLIEGQEVDSIKSIRESNSAFFNPRHQLESLLEPYVKRANKLWNFSLYGWECVQFGEYNVGGFFDWHMDTQLGNLEVNDVRKLSITVNLSNPESYCGGDFEIANTQGQPLKMPQAALRQQGTVVVFPSFLNHRVTQVTTGTRYSLVQWIHGPDFI